jgi:hypothetical protein
MASKEARLAALPVAAWAVAQAESMAAAAAAAGAAAAVWLGNAVVS